MGTFSFECPFLVSWRELLDNEPDHDFGLEAAPAGRKESVQVPVCCFFSRTDNRMHK